MMAMIRISINNWEKYNPRSDRKNYSWFRFENDFFHDQRVFVLDDRQQNLLIYLMCEVSKKNGEAIELLTSYVCAMRKCTEEELIQDIQAVAEIGFLTIELGDLLPSDGSQDDDTTPRIGRPTRRTIRDVRYETIRDETSPQNQIATKPEVSDSRSGAKTKTKPPAGSHTAKPREFVAAYCERFKLRWGHNPEILGKDAGIAKRFAKDLSLEKFSLYLDAYFAMPDAWIVKAKHPLGLMETKFNEIQSFAQSGKFITMHQARQADQFAATASQLERIKRGEL